MAHYIFIQGVRPGFWELLEKIERSELAEEVFRNYKQRLSGRNHETIAMVEASNVFEGQAKLKKDPQELLCSFNPYTSAPKPYRTKMSDR